MNAKALAVEMPEGAVAPWVREHLADAGNPIEPTHCPHGVLLVPSCSGHGKFLCTLGAGHVCMPDPCAECEP